MPINNENNKKDIDIEITEINKGFVTIQADENTSDEEIKKLVAEQIDAGNYYVTEGGKYITSQMAPKKIYCVVDEWTKDLDSYHTVKLFDNEKDALKCYNECVKCAKDDAERYGFDRHETCENVGQNDGLWKSEEFYLDGEYSENHICEEIYVREVK